MPEHCQPSGFPVKTALAKMAVDKMSNLVRSLSDALDKDLDDFIRELGLPPDSSTWIPTLATRLRCHEAVFQQRALTELKVHREALLKLYPVEDGEAGDLIDGISSDAAHARQCFEELENVWHHLNFLGENYLLRLDDYDRDQMQAAHPFLRRTYERLYQDLSGINRDICEWDDCFRTVVGDAGFQACFVRLDRGAYNVPGVFERDLLPAFNQLRDFAKAREGIREESAKWRKEAIQEWSLRAEDRFSAYEALNDLRQYEDVNRILFEQSCLQSDAMDSIKRVIQDSAVQTSTIRSVTHAALPMEKVHEAFHRYEEIRVTCARVVDCCMKAVVTMKRYVTLLEQVRDGL
ncbi:hypothetical protein BV20DRAFT_1058537 [Pilatotrama ljubarskyi]|nr:hypothetical protein BV20DRAFT_1058537 [Pilatotrama ljubarskyi]